MCAPECFQMKVCHSKMRAVQRRARMAFPSMHDQADASSPLRAARNVQEWLLQPYRGGAEGPTPTASSAPYTMSVSGTSGPPAGTVPSDSPGNVSGTQASEAEQAQLDTAHTAHTSDVQLAVQGMRVEGGDEETGTRTDTAHSVVLSLSDTDGPRAGLSATLNPGGSAYHVSRYAQQVSLLFQSRLRSEIRPSHLRSARHSDRSAVRSTSRKA